MSYNVGTHFSWNERQDTERPYRLYDVGTRVLFVKQLDDEPYKIGCKFLRDVVYS